MPRLATSFLIVAATLFFLTGCAPLLDLYFRNTLPRTEGLLSIEGIDQPVTVRRDNLGIPMIEARGMGDLAFAAGYVNAADRLAQMIGFKLMAQGRLSEMMGNAALDIDIYMRSFNLFKAARIIFEAAAPDTKEILRRYSAGVNAYIDGHGDSLPPEFILSGYAPGPWEPVDSASIFMLFTFGLGFNLREEIDFLNIAARIGPEKAAWLFPVYPDEPLPLAEAEKLAGIVLSSTENPAEESIPPGDQLPLPAMSGIPASNNWAIAKSRTAGGASLFANDTHLPVYLPSLWNMMHLRCPDYDAAGIAIAGVPGIVAGFNGRLAWGMTMVMADNQDLFLEQSKIIDGKRHYLYKDAWLPTVERKEVFFVKGEAPLTKTIHETIHGPLIGDSLPAVRKLELLTHRAAIPCDLALSWPVFEPDRSMDAFLSLGKARSVHEALEFIRNIRMIPLNIVCADHDNIAWQVTGRYPLRKKGRGLFPSPGWTGDHDWTGFLDVDMHPSRVNPPEGFVFSANNRTVPADFPFTLSSSWYWPERGERIAQMIGTSTTHTFRTTMAMQCDVQSLFVAKLKQALLTDPFHGELMEEIEGLPDGTAQEGAREALAMLERFDGAMTTESPDAPIIGALIHTATYHTFYDELGPEEHLSWQSFLDTGNTGYCAQYDHLAVRGDESPFWDDITTEPRERKARIIARSLADALTLLERALGRDRDKWQWGRLHTCRWATESTRLAPFMDLKSRIGLSLLSSYLNRGPYPVPGDYTTLNVSGYHTARDFDTWLIPEMRIIADFSLDEPFMAMNSTGQSGNPASPHYDDAIALFLDGSYRPLPFREENIKKQYTRLLTLRPLH